MEKGLAVANLFIRLGSERDDPPTQMKLQKLVYFAHGWHLALAGEPLVDEEFQAWKYGPVLPSVYRVFRHWGTRGIAMEGTVWAIAADEKLERLAPVVSPRGQDIVPRFVRRIQDVYGKWNGTQLAYITHLDGSPWKLARAGHPDDARNIPIPDRLMRECFRRQAHASKG